MENNEKENENREEKKEEDVLKEEGNTDDNIKCNILMKNIEEKNIKEDENKEEKKEENNNGNIEERTLKFRRSRNYDSNRKR